MEKPSYNVGDRVAFIRNAQLFTGKIRTIFQPAIATDAPYYGIDYKNSVGNDSFCYIRDEITKLCREQL